MVGERNAVLELGTSGLRDADRYIASRWDLDVLSSRAAQGNGRI